MLGFRRRSHKQPPPCPFHRCLIQLLACWRDVKLFIVNQFFIGWIVIRPPHAILCPFLSTALLLPGGRCLLIITVPSDISPYTHTEHRVLVYSLFCSYTSFLKMILWYKSTNPHLWGKMSRKNNLILEAKNVNFFNVVLIYYGFHFQIGMSSRSSK